MEFLQFVGAALVAVYAMVGGAFINASITAPENAAKLLSAGWESVLLFLLYGIAFLVIWIAVQVFTPNLPIEKNPFLWVSAAHICLYLVFLGCRRIIEILLADEHPKAEHKEPDAE
ncbi:hypothetical protein [Paenirhodobacter populi]|uniref:Uncharacterized protein n=1 Tax=Paenirhodobacter populi TaxID=2306993 RepID=A0A443IPN5_9RHOB|nr:hypothetical protein [Sinirhodobacter populi]RWR08528.1 hypothetical protein D2T33_15645 [Sinirhodobacter populi]